MRILLAMLMIVIINGCSPVTKKASADGNIHIIAKYNGGNWINPDNRTDTIILPKKDGVINFAKVLILDRNNSVYRPDGGYVWAWKGKYEVRLLISHGEEFFRYGGNGNY